MQKCKSSKISTRIVRTRGTNSTRLQMSKCVHSAVLPPYHVNEQNILHPVCKQLGPRSVHDKISSTLDKNATPAAAVAATCCLLLAAGAAPPPPPPPEGHDDGFTKKQNRPFFDSDNNLDTRVRMNTADTPGACGSGATEGRPSALRCLPSQVVACRCQLVL